MKEAKLLEGLKYIRRHIKMISPTGYRMSAVWNIADQAIKEYEKDDK